MTRRKRTRKLESFAEIRSLSARPLARSLAGSLVRLHPAESPSGKTARRCQKSERQVEWSGEEEREMVDAQGRAGGRLTHRVPPATFLLPLVRPGITFASSRFSFGGPDDDDADASDEEEVVVCVKYWR